MTLVRINLNDNLEPLQFTLKPEDELRFRKFMGELNDNQKINDNSCDGFVVLDEDLNHVYSSKYSDFCHEHINDAIELEIEDANKWIVRGFSFAKTGKKPALKTPDIKKQVSD